MEIKHKKPLLLACLINIGLGSFLFICGFLEFINVLNTPANNVYTVNIQFGIQLGVQLSYLVFVSGILILVSGLFTVLNRRDMKHINMQILVGAIALAWPIFVSLTLFVSIRLICIRLLPTTLASMFYMITILVVKISNEALHKTHKVKLKVNIGEKRRKGLNIQNKIKSGLQKQSRTSTKNINSIGKLTKKVQSKNNLGTMKKKLFSHKRISNPFNKLKLSVSKRRPAKRRRTTIRLRRR